MLRDITIQHGRSYMDYVSKRPSLPDLLDLFFSHAKVP